MERDNATLRALFTDAREAKDNLLVEMSQLEEERLKVETERAAFLAREGQLAQFIVNRGLAVPPVYHLPPVYAAVLSQYTLGLPNTEPTPGPGTAGLEKFRSGNEASTPLHSASALRDGGFGPAGAALLLTGGVGSGGNMSGGSSSRVGPTRSAPPPPSTPTPGLGTVTVTVTAAPNALRDQLEAIKAEASLLRSSSGHFSAGSSSSRRL